MSRIYFFIPGVPIPQGSKNVYHGRVVDSNKNLRPWRTTIRTTVEKELGDQWEPITECCCVSLFFYLPRPKYHYRTGKHAGQLKPRYADIRMGRKPDIDKLIRATLDGFTDARLWVDDALVDCVVLRKLYQGTQVPVGVNVVVEWEGAAI